MGAGLSARLFAPRGLGAAAGRSVLRPGGRNRPEIVAAPGAGAVGWVPQRGQGANMDGLSGPENAPLSWQMFVLPLMPP